MVLEEPSWERRPIAEEPLDGLLGDSTGLCSGRPCERGGHRAGSERASGAHKEGDFILRDIKSH